MIGTTLQHYRIVRSLGSGGMGDVYLAEDTRLGRHVALKILPARFGLDAERLERFQREARVIAALNHPNVVTLFDIEHADGVHFLTMEVVEGRTFADLIPAGGLPLAQLLRIAVPLVDAVAAAHERGIIHRDLKPANVMLGPEGRVKVLDFGLAKLRTHDEPAVDGAETRTRRDLTTQHQVMGTAPYMSPEQAEGRVVDARSDIFSLGILLYEATTGERPFQGDTALSVLSSIIKDSPRPPLQVRPGIPRELDRIVRRCLAKEPGRRYQSAVDLRNDLEELQQLVLSGLPLDPVVTSQPPALRRSLVLAGACLAVTALALGWYVISRGGAGGAPPGSRFVQITSQPGVEWFPSISPDGKWVVYSGTAGAHRHIYLQSVSGQNPMELTHDSSDDDQPVFSPDGERIAFRSTREGGGIFVMGRTGEALRRISRMGFNPAWSPDGAQLVFATEGIDINPQNGAGRSDLWVAAIGGGEPRKITQLDAVLPAWSPHGRRIAYTHRFAGPMRTGVYTIPATGGTPLPVTDGVSLDWNPVWAPDGKHLYFISDRGGTMNLWRVPIDERSGETQGEPEPIMTPAASMSHVSISADGTRIAYTSALVTSNIQRLDFDPVAGAIMGQPEWLTTGSRRWSSPDPSPDGGWVAFYSLVGPDGDLYVAKPDGTGFREVTGDAAIDRVPRWSPDGQWIACFSNRSGQLEVWKVRPDGSDLRQLTEGNVAMPVWSPDGTRIAATRALEWPDKAATVIFDPSRGWNEQTPEVLPRPPGRSDDVFTANSWSPDGEFLVGEASLIRHGVITYSPRKRRFERISDFGEWPVWLPDSRRVLFVANGNAFYLVDTRTRQTRKIFSTTRDVIGPPRLTRDGTTMYFSRRVTEADVWLASFKAPDSR